MVVKKKNKPVPEVTPDISLDQMHKLDLEDEQIESLFEKFKDHSKVQEAIKLLEKIADESGQHYPLFLMIATTNSNVLLLEAMRMVAMAGFISQQSKEPVDDLNQEIHAMIIRSITLGWQLHKSLGETEKEKDIPDSMRRVV